MPQPPIFEPPKEWVAPQSLPDLSEAKEIAVDLETHDPQIKNLGPGWATSRGKVIGIALAVDGWKGYFPIAHEGGGNFDENLLRPQIQKLLSTNVDKIFHNASYDVGWLRQWGVEVKGRWIDTMIV